MKTQLGQYFFGLSVTSDASIEGLTEPVEARLQVRCDVTFEGLEGDEPLGLRGLELFAALHHRHQKRGRWLGIGAVGLRASQREERLGATQRIAKDAPRLVDGDRLVEGATPLGRHALQMTVGMERARQLSVHALELGQVDGKCGRDPKACKRVHADYTVKE